MPYDLLRSIVEMKTNHRSPAAVAMQTFWHRRALGGSGSFAVKDCCDKRLEELLVRLSPGDYTYLSSLLAVVDHIK
jgi:hypothetical protein